VDDPALQGTGVLIYDSSRNRAENLLFDNLKETLKNPVNWHQVQA
jgi:hypothetical protein